MQIQPGDVVQLKSGGPRMTVNHIEGTGVVCVWFVAHKREIASFEITTLEKLSGSSVMARV